MALTVFDVSAMLLTKTSQVDDEELCKLDVLGLAHFTLYQYSFYYLFISISRYCFLLSQSHIFTFSHYGLTYPHAISYFMLHLHYPFMNKGTVVTEYYFISFC